MELMMALLVGLIFGAVIGVAVSIWLDKVDEALKEERRR